MLDINILKENAEDVKHYKAKEKELEKQGIFNEDVDEINYDDAYPVTEDFPFIRKGIKFWFKHKFYLHALEIYTKKINKELTNLKIVGKENLKGVKGAIVTCNHISKVDSFAVRAAVGLDIMYVAADYNNWKNPLGVIGRHTGYIPLSTTLDRKVMRKFNEAIEYYLEKKKKKILIYPEQAMWREEARPRPLKDGAFHYAYKHNVPIIPLFITMKPKETMVDEQGRRNLSDYTLHILPPIYPNPDLDKKENVKMMREKNSQLWAEVYEKTYGKKVEFNTEKSE